MISGLLEMIHGCVVMRSVIFGLAAIFVSGCAYDYTDRGKYSASREVVYQSNIKAQKAGADKTRIPADLKIAIPKVKDGRSRLFLVSVGINNYLEGGYNLQYSVQDARSLAEFFERERSKLKIDDMSVTLLVDEQATRERILETIERVISTSDGDDTVMIFLAGHGIRHQASGSYYFLTYRSNLDNVHRQGLSWFQFNELVSALKKKCASVILFVDTCHSGSLYSAVRGISVRQKDLSLELDREGLFVLSASQSFEEAQELFSKGHGAFTLALLRGLEGQADSDNDRVVDILELFKYTSQSVPRLTNDKQHPHFTMGGSVYPLIFLDE